MTPVSLNQEMPYIDSSRCTIAFLIIYPLYTVKKLGKATGRELTQLNEHSFGIAGEDIHSSGGTDITLKGNTAVYSLGTLIAESRYLFAQQMLKTEETGSNKSIHPSAFLRPPAQGSKIFLLILYLKRYQKATDVFSGS